MSFMNDKSDPKKVKYLGNMLYEPQRSVRLVQVEQKPWVAHNFGDRPSWMPLVGVMEELGELAHHFLKMHQGIRGTKSEHMKAIKDAVADIVIFLCDFCSAHDIDLEKEVLKTWKQVKKRDWKKDKKKGVCATKAVQEKK